MDKNFLEFWGHYLLNLVQTGQKHAGEKFYEDVFNFWGGFMKDQKSADWLFSPSSYFEKQVDIFQKSYGLKKDTTPDYFAEARKASEQFQKSLKEFISAFDVVPREEYEELKKKYEELQAKSAEHDDTIRQLRAKLLVKGAEEIGAASGIQEMIKTQTDQFAALMDSLGSIYSGSPAKQDKSEKTRKPKTTIVKR